MDTYRLDEKEDVRAELIAPSPAWDESWDCTAEELEALEAHPLVLLHAITLVDY
ncbi:MAG TPA: hypothetical protein VE710_10280 [Candidatus Bathyarchaeia archaeon]|nr:hypothetical protein [Candidatus Bathyarchaeia archaeon]